MGKKGKGKSRDKGSKKKRKKAAAIAEFVASSSVVSDTSSAEGEAAGRSVAQHRSIDPTELAARLASLSTVLRRHLARVDAGDGLTRARLSALTLLVLGGPRTLGGLAAAERVRPPTMTRLVRAMEADGLVTREPNPADGRSIVIRATVEGQRRLERGRARQIAPLAERISDLDRGERLLLEDAADLLGRLLRDGSWEPLEPTE